MAIDARSCAAAGLVALCCTGHAAAQGALAPFSPPAGRVVVQERSDFSKYEDARYVGHVYREARLDLSLDTIADGTLEYSGEALVFEETMRDERAVSRRLDGSVPVAFIVGKGGAARFSTDEGYPILRGVPSAPEKPEPVGGRWTGEGVVVVRPRPGSPATRIPVLVEYEYRGETRYGDRPARAIQARYAVRYKGSDRLGDPAMSSASGGRTADIIIDAEDGSTLFIRETVDETFSYVGGQSVRLKGFILHFHRGSLPGDRERVASLLVPLPSTGAPGAGAPGAVGAGGPTPFIATPPTVTAAPPAAAPPPDATSPIAAVRPPSAPAPVLSGIAPGGAFELAPGDRGLVLLLYDLRFVADGDQLLPTERSRLDAIAEALKRLPERSFLVEGHTADLGKPAGQYELSEKRAKRIVDELVARGIPPGRFVFRGLGAEKPIAPNDTESNRARNRRVEITVLD